LFAAQKLSLTCAATTPAEGDPSGVAFAATKRCGGSRYHQLISCSLSCKLPTSQDGKKH